MVRVSSNVWQNPWICNPNVTLPLIRGTYPRVSKAIFSHKQLLENGFPGDMALTPKESLHMYDTMVSVWPHCESLQVSALVITISIL